MEHKITALKVQKRNTQRVNVYLDGEFAFGLARIVAAWLHVGQNISDEKITQLRCEDEKEAAYQRAINLLSQRPHTRNEVRQNLERHAIPDETIQMVLERLQENGLLNDARFAQTWIENRGSSRPRGRRALAFELRKRGIEQQIIDQALEQTDDEALAYQAALKHSRKLRELAWPDFKQKMIAFLGRRGFSYDICAPATQQVWEDLQQPDRIES